jgi:integrase
MEIELAPSGGEVVVQADLSDEVRAGIEEYVSASLAPETRRAYLVALKPYWAWCQTAGRTACPADPETVAAYLTYMAKERSLKPSTIKLAKSAISAAHERNGYENPTRTSLVRDVVRGIDKTHRSGRPRQARAATGEDIRAMASKSTRLVDKRDAAILLVGFGAALRRSEIVALDVEDVTRDRKGRTLVHISHSKTDQTGKGHDAVLPDEAAQAVWTWIAAADIKTGPLFLRMGRGPKGEEGSPTRHRLTSHAVRDIIRKRAEEAGLEETHGPKWSGHSLRRGAATEADANGASELAIKRLGRWNSMSAVSRYIDPNKDVGDLSALLGLRPVRPVEPACWNWPAPVVYPDQDDHDALVDWHGGRCAICDGAAGDVLDHDHHTGFVRGWLCKSCNVTEGRSDEEVFVKYRERNPATILGVEMIYSGRMRYEDSGKFHEVSEEEELRRQAEVASAVVSQLHI